jgi:CheY-like chemotaxis protein
MSFNQKVDEDLIKLNDRPKKILVVEDDKINIFLMQRILLPLKFDVEIAENGLIALEKFQQFTFDLILMDLYMPIMDGFEATKRIRELSKTPPIIIISAATLNEVELKQKIGNDYFMSKPFEVIKFKKLLSEIFA